MTACVPGTTYT